MNKQKKIKETQLHWCEEIPEEWGIKKIKYVSTIKNGATPLTSNSNFWDGDIFWTTPVDVSKSEYIVKTERTITEEGYKSCGTNKVPAGSIIITTRAPIGNISIAGVELCTNQGCKSIVPRDINSKYAYYQAVVQKDWMKALGQGTTFTELSNENLSNIYFLIPPIEQQKSIASFLDQKTTEIDNLISKKKQLITCLKDERIGVISRAVTKGVEDNTSIKKSKNEWLIEIPEKWSEKKLKFMTIYFKGFAFKSADFSQTGIPIVKATNIKNWQIENVKEFIEIENQKEEFEKVRLKKGDIIISTVGSKPDVVNSAVGQLAIISEEFTNAYLNQNTVCIRPSYEIDAGFLKFSMLSNYFRSNLNSECAWIANQAYLEVEDILSISIPVPPTIDEQIEIVNYINNKLQIIAQSILKIEQEIELIKEYRTSLINEIVTGKITLN